MNHTKEAEEPDSLVYGPTNHRGFPWDEAPWILLRDRPRICGRAFRDWVTAMSMLDTLTPPRSPWKNGYVVRVIVAIRRGALGHIVALGERYLRRTLNSYFAYYNET